MKKLSPDLDLYWRVMKEKKEIEFVLRLNGTSWVGLGWRPRDLNATCKNFPLITPHGVVDSIARPVKDVDQTSEAPAASPEPEPASTSEPAPKQKRNVVADFSDFSPEGRHGRYRRADKEGMYCCNQIYYSLIYFVISER